MNEWVSQQIRGFQQLVGRRISHFEGVEMAIREVGEGGLPQFSEDDVPCLQLSLLWLHLDDGSVAEIGTYQDDTEWGLCLARPAVVRPTGHEGIFRFRRLGELTGGRVTAVEPRRSGRGNLSEVGLFLDGREMRLIAGEIYEDSERLRFCRKDESVLVFPHARDPDRIAWEGGD